MLKLSVFSVSPIYYNLHESTVDTVHMEVIGGAFAALVKNIVKMA